jgi:glutamyl-tRNA synthetase
VLAWLFARLSGRRFLLRIEDLDTAFSTGNGRSAAGRPDPLGIIFDGEPVVQSQRLTAYHDALPDTGP